MYPPSQIDTLIAAVQTAKDLKEAMTDGNLDNFVAGLKDAKETIIQADEIKQQLQEAVEVEAANKVTQQAIDDANDKLGERENTVSDRESAVADGEKKNKADAEKNAEDAARNQKLADALAGQKATQDEREDTIQADLDAAAEAKQKAQDRLAALNKVPEGE